MEARKLSTLEAVPFELSLRIRHPSIDPAEISRGLGLEAIHSFRAGEPRRPGGAPTSAHSESYWLGTLDPTSWPPEAWFSGFEKAKAVDDALRIAATSSLSWALSLSARRLLRVKELFDSIRTSGGQASLLVVVTPAAVESFSIAPGVSRILADLGITIEFELGGE